MSESRTFGEREHGAAYRDRPGAYAIIADERARIAVVLTPSGMHLPGGGQDSGETLEQTLAREVLEECGLEVIAQRLLVRATEFIHAPDEGHFAKHCHFYVACISSAATVASELDHELQWIGSARVATELKTECQRWVLREYLAGRSALEASDSSFEA